MKLVVTMLAVAAAVVSTGAAGGTASSVQRIAITAGANGNADEFVLHPYGSGPVASDSGTTGACCWGDHWIKRDGQEIEVNDPLKTFYGKHGQFSYRARIEWVDAGNGYSVGTGTWKIVSGTGVYSHLTGGGRLALSWPPAGLVSWRAEGLVRQKGAAS
jgi:hypothetical protein